MTGLAALMASPALPVGVGSAFAAASPTTGARPKGPRLRPGDTIGLIEPASRSDEAFDITLVEEAIIAMGLKPMRGQHVLNEFGYLAGQDKDRAADLTAMFADKDVRAIFAVRGGWGSARLLPFVDWDVVRANPKFVLGYSDITALHMAIAAKGGAITLHGPNASSAWGKASLESFRPIAFDGATLFYKNPVTNDDRLVQRRWRTQTLTPGKAQGHLLGGNLTVLTALAGTPYLPSFDGAILFLEDVDEAEYRIDRMLTQLGQAGVFKNLAGVVFGQCTSCVASNGSTSPFTLSDILRQHLASLGVPAYQGAWFGHISDQFTLPVGARAEIDADAGTLRLLEAAVV
ncbi:S66 peptidase family protein [Sphingorhabdus sp.]|jgi:muramoyltetrapeptide carboxypeptidase|uniref:S66 peptidase family protein n=2 Tax=Sphingorhabdus sp. TaxID=1902408 RepID=UPI003C743C1C|nr:LD-carboxypeptidase [Sphingomonadales bacterium]